MGQLFESFVRNYLRTEHPELGNLRRKQIDWSGEPRTDGSRRFPIMEADIYIPHAGGRSVIVETKCVSRTFADRGRSGTGSLRSDHLYQLFAYLTNHRAQTNLSEKPALGVLLYATTEATFDYRYRLHGHPLWVRSINLSEPWAVVGTNLGRFAHELAEQAETGDRR